MNEMAEEILLGSILKDNSILEDITILPDQFLDLTNRHLYKAMLAVKRKGFPIDGASLKDEMGEGFFFAGGNERLLTYMNAVPSIHAFKSYQQMIINQWKVSSTQDILRAAIDGELTIESVQALIRDLSKVDEQGTQEDFNLKEHLKEMYELITVPVPKKPSGIVTGYLDIDQKTDGFQNNDLVIVGARPSMGKTAFLLNLALNSAKTSKSIPVIFSLEMSKKSLLKRLMSCIAEVDGMKLKNPYHYTDDKEKERWKKGLHVLKDIKPSRDHKGNMHAQITEISADLKGVTKDFNCPVICLAQLSRSVEQRGDKHPMMSDLRESGSIEQDADIIMMLYRDEYYNETTEENRNLLEVNILKNRDGVIGLVKLLYKKEINKIENLYHYHNQKK